jgi:hypothetical protein
MAEIKMETRCLLHNHPGTQVIHAYVKAREGPSDGWHFTIMCDEEAEEPGGSAMSARLSKRYASYDEAVLGMNEKLAALLSPDLEPCELRGCKGYQHAE